MSNALRLLKDDAAAIASQIEELRQLTPANDVESASIAERIDGLVSRSEKILPQMERERALDSRIANLRSTVVDACEHRDALSNGDVATIEAAGSIAKRAFGSTAEARKVGLGLRAIARGETRAMGETNSGYGSEYVVTQLYGAVVNLLKYTSQAFQVASTFETNSNVITFPKVGEITAAFVAENADSTDQDIATSGASCTVRDMRASVPVSNSLIEDSPVDVAGLVAERIAYGYAKGIDSVWLKGYSAGGITVTGLYDAITGYNSGSNVVTVAKTVATTVGNFADLVGKIDPYAINPSWVVGSAGWAEIMKVSSTLLNANITEGTQASLWGVPVRKSYTMPANVYAMYGDFGFTTAIAYKPAGLQITAARELLIRKNATLFVGIQRFGVLNHAPEFGGALVKATV
jgi:HK97 family phage major capsid protein